jgi:hypothetical protein
MIDMAEAEESKEALLAYLFLSASKKRLSKEELDKQIEAYMLERYKIPMDFEVDDGVRKLLELAIVYESDNLLHVRDIEDTIKDLRKVIKDEF